MSFLVFWLICVVVSGMAMIGMECWDARHTKEYKGLTLADMLLGLLVVVIPIVNVVVIIGCFIYFCSEIAPKVVFFRSKDAK